jgi:hypothetical protein
LQEIGSGNLLGFHQRFGGPNAFLADAKQLLRESRRPLGHKHVIETASHVGQHALSLRLPSPLGLPNLLLSHAAIEPEFSGGDDFLADETALLAALPFIADFGTDIARHRIRIQSDLNATASRGLNAMCRLSHGGIASYGHLLQFGQRHAYRRSRLSKRLGNLLRLTGRRHWGLRGFGDDSQITSVGASQVRRSYLLGYSCVGNHAD